MKRRKRERRLVCLAYFLAHTPVDAGNGCGKLQRGQETSKYANWNIYFLVQLQIVRIKTPMYVFNVQIKSFQELSPSAFVPHTGQQINLGGCSKRVRHTSSLWIKNYTSFVPQGDLPALFVHKCMKTTSAQHGDGLSLSKLIAAVLTGKKCFPQMCWHVGNTNKKKKEVHCMLHFNVSCVPSERMSPLLICSLCHWSQGVWKFL